MDRTITTEMFNQTVQEAAHHRSREYSDTYSLSIRWERDDSIASLDCCHFQRLLQTLQLPKAQELIIAHDDATPGWTVEGKFRTILNAAKQTNDRALVIVHYAGYSSQEEEGASLYLVECYRGSHVNTMMYMVGMVLPGYGYDLRDEGNVDILFIFDCSYAPRASRDPGPTKRIVEIIAAADEQARSGAQYPPRPAVTAKLVEEIKRRQKDGHRYVEFAELIQTLRARPVAVKQRNYFMQRNARKRPTHALKMGARSVCLPLSGAATVNPQHIQPEELRAIFGVHLADTMTTDEIENL